MSVSVLPATRLPAASQQRGVVPMDPQLVEILGSPPILDGESLDTYNAMHDRARSAAAPADFIEEIWVRDVVDLTWEVLRLRRMKAKFINARSSEGVGRLLDDLVDYEEKERLVRGWIDEKASAVKRVDKLMEWKGYDQETVNVETLADNLHDVERFERLTMQAEARRNMVIREMDRHRDLVARLQAVVAEIDEADIVDVTDTAPELEAAA